MLQIKHPWGRNSLCVFFHVTMQVCDLFLRSVAKSIIECSREWWGQELQQNPSLSLFQSFMNWRFPGVLCWLVCDTVYFLKRHSMFWELFFPEKRWCKLSCITVKRQIIEKTFLHSQTVVHIKDGKFAKKKKKQKIYGQRFNDYSVETGKVLKLQYGRERALKKFNC